MKIYIVVTDVVNDVTYSRKSVITRVVIRFYDMTLSTGKQRRHMINDTYKNVSRTFYLPGNIVIFSGVTSKNNTSIRF